MPLGLLREGLVIQLSHAGYLGEELAKAQTALQFGLRYDQDRPLRPSESQPTPVPEISQPPTVQETAGTSSPQMTPRMPPVRQPMTLKQLEAASPGSRVNITLVVTNLPRTQILSSNFLEPDEAEPFNAFH